MSEIKIKEVMEEIYHKLQDGDTRLSEEQAETYREIVLKLWKSTEDEVPFELGNIDAEIISMLGFFESAVIRGNLKTANQVLAAVTEGIRFARLPVAGATASEKERIRKKREETLHRLNLLLKFQDHYDELEIKIRAIQEKQEECMTEIHLAEKEVDAYQDEKSYYEQKVSRVISGKERLTPDTKEFVNKVNRLAEARNNYNRHRILKEILMERSQILLNSIHTINQIAFGSVEILGQETMEDLKHTMDQYEKNVNDQKKQNKEIKYIIGHMDRILDSAAEMADESCTGNDELAADWEKLKKKQKEMKRGQDHVEMHTL